jgi:hypothetical protein
MRAEELSWLIKFSPRQEPDAWEPDSRNVRHLPLNFRENHKTKNVRRIGICQCILDSYDGPQIRALI